MKVSIPLIVLAVVLSACGKTPALPERSKQLVPGNVQTVPYWTRSPWAERADLRRAPGMRLRVEREPPVRWM